MIFDDVSRYLLSMIFYSTYILSVLSLAARFRECKSIRCIWWSFQWSMITVIISLQHNGKNKPFDSNRTELKTLQNFVYRFCHSLHWHLKWFQVFLIRQLNVYIHWVSLSQLFLTKRHHCCRSLCPFIIGNFLIPFHNFSTNWPLNSAMICN